MKVKFRPIEEGDLPFLRNLYALAKEEEMPVLSTLPEAQKEAFLDHQFEAQYGHYTNSFPNAQFDLILDRDGTPIGRYYVDRRPNQIRILDITLVPARRGTGIGTKLLQGLLEEGKEKELPVRIVLQETESSHSLFKRLGFKQIEKEGPNDLLEWRASADESSEMTADGVDF